MVTTYIIIFVSNRTLMNCSERNYTNDEVQARKVNTEVEKVIKDGRSHFQLHKVAKQEHTLNVLELE